MLVSYQGYRNRAYAVDRTMATIDEPSAAYEIWMERNVRGRLLLLFDFRPRMFGLKSYQGAPQLGDDNVIEYAVLKNIVRKIYLVIPDEGWETFRRRIGLKILRNTGDRDDNLVLYTINGISVIATTPTSLPRLREEPLVYINSSRFSPEGVLDTLKQRGISSDVVLVYRKAQ